MATDYSITFGTLPFFLFPCQKFFNTFLFDVLQVFNHAHPIEGLVSLIKMLQLGAWKIFAFIAVFDFLI